MLQSDYNAHPFQCILYYINVSGNPTVYAENLSNVCQIYYDTFGNIAITGWLLGVSPPPPTTPTILGYSLATVLSFYSFYYSDVDAILNMQPFNVTTTDLGQIRTEPQMIGCVVFDTTAEVQKNWTGASWVPTGSGVYLPLAGGTMAGDIAMAAHNITNAALVTSALGMPTSGVLSSCTGYAQSALTGLGAGVSTWLGTPSSANLRAAVTDGGTGTGAIVCATSPSLVTPDVGTPTAGVLSSCTGYAQSALTGLGAGVSTWLGTPSSANLFTAMTTKTGSGGSLVFATGPTLSAPLLGTPASGVLSSCTGYAQSALTGLGAGVSTWLGTPSSANLRAAVTDGGTGTGAIVCATSPSLTTPSLGTPTAGVLSSCTGYAQSALTGLGTGISTWLGTPSSANLRAAVTEGGTGTGAIVCATSPSLTTPSLGTPTAGVLSSCTGYAQSALTGLGTGVSTWLGTPTTANLETALGQKLTLSKFGQNGATTQLGGSAAETTLLSTGTGSLTYAANETNIGTSIRFHLDIFSASAHATDTLTIRIKSGAAIYASVVYTLIALSNSAGEIDATVQIRSGSTGSGYVKLLYSGQSAVFGVGADTWTISSSNTVDVTAQFSSNNASNFIRCDNAYVETIMKTV